VKDPNTTYNGEPIIFRILEHGHTGDPAGTTALECRDIISLKCFDAKEPSNSDSNRKQYGNNRYLYSNLSQWLNSNAAANAWYTAKHSADQKPDSSNVWQQSGTAINPYDTEAGFLTNFSAELRDALQTVSKTTAKNTVTDGGGSETVQSKIFLLSNTEVGLANENNIAEGTIYKYYSDDNQNSRRVKKVATAAACGNYTGTSAGSAWYWWLRTPIASYSYYARVVDTDGSLNYGGAYSGNYGVSPAFCVLSSLTVGDTPDASGVYSMQFNATPSVTPASRNYGEINAAPTITVEVVDEDGDTYNGVVTLNGSQVQTFSGISSGSYPLDMTSIWANAPVGSQSSIVVTVTDSQSATATVTYTFTKSNASSIPPTISGLSNNMRIPASYYVNFTTSTDAEGESQTIKAQTADNAGFTNPTDFTSIEEYDSESQTWNARTTPITNDDVGKAFRIAITGTVNTSEYVRVVSTDAGSQTPSCSTAYNVKVGDVLEVITPPWNRDNRPSVVSVIMDATIDAAATTEIFVCNNANDTTPTWETYTGDKHIFENKTKTDANWAVAARIKVTAGLATGEISISDIGLGVL